MPSETALPSAKHKIIAPYLDGTKSMAAIARENDISLRTLWSWLKSYQNHGIAGLERKVRTDKGVRRNITPELQEIIVELMSQVPRLTITSIFRKIKTVCMHKGMDPPSYSVVYDLVRELSDKATSESLPLNDHDFEIFESSVASDVGLVLETSE